MCGICSPACAGRLQAAVTASPTTELGPCPGLWGRTLPPRQSGPQRLALRGALGSPVRAPPSALGMACFGESVSGGLLLSRPLWGDPLPPPGPPVSEASSFQPGPGASRSAGTLRPCRGCLGPRSSGAAPHSASAPFPGSLWFPTGGAEHGAPQPQLPGAEHLLAGQHCCPLCLHRCVRTGFREPQVGAVDSPALPGSPRAGQRTGPAWGWGWGTGTGSG